jgi:ribonuclease HI
VQLWGSLGGIAAGLLYAVHHADVGHGHVHLQHPSTTAAIGQLAGLETRLSAVALPLPEDAISLTTDAAEGAAAALIATEDGQVLVRAVLPVTQAQSSQAWEIEGLALALATVHAHAPAVITWTTDSTAAAAALLRGHAAEARTAARVQVLRQWMEARGHLLLPQWHPRERVSAVDREQKAVLLGLPAEFGPGTRVRDLVTPEEVAHHLAPLFPSAD